MFSVACTRFTNETWNENVEWRRRHNHAGCIYGSPTDISETLSNTVFVLEMNNDTNRVMGVGKLVIGTATAPVTVTNANINSARKYNVYESRNYNRYKFVGKERVDRATVIDADPRLSSIFNRLDRLLFKTARHCKRGHGIQAIPKWIPAAAKQRGEGYLLWRFFDKLISASANATTITAAINT